MNTPDTNQSANYHILDTSVRIESDSAEFIDLFDRDYNWFRVKSLDGNEKLRFLVRLNGNDEKTFVRQGNMSFSLGGHPRKLKQAYQLVLKQVFDSIKTFFLIHAGVAAKQGKIIVLAGSPGVGKSTTVLELLKNGFSFFSDDFCPIHRETRMVHPFPRSLWIASDKHLASPDPLRGKKAPMKPDEFPWKIAEIPGKISRLICLDAGEHGTEFCQVNVVLRKSSNAITDELRQLKTVEVTCPYPNLQEWEIRYPKGMGLTGSVRQLLERHKANIWNAFRVDAICPDFEKEPVLTPISAHEAGFRLMREIKNKIDWYQEDTPKQPMSPVNMLMELSELIADVPCYSLSVGKLDSTRKLILELMRED